MDTNEGGRGGLFKSGHRVNPRAGIGALLAHKKKRAAAA
jgi:hypothetical protein